LRCACGHILPLARSLQQLFATPPDEPLPELRRGQTHAVLIGALLGAASGFVITLLAMPFVVLACLILTCGATFIDWNAVLPWLLLGGLGIGGFIGCTRAVNEWDLHDRETDSFGRWGGR
jgi:hypothetical protein